MPNKLLSSVVYIANSKRSVFTLKKNKMPMTGAEALGYEYGMILRTAVYLLVAQMSYVCFTYLIFTFPGSTAIWLFLMYLAASVVTVAQDIDAFGEALPDPLPQNVRITTDLAVFFVTSGFLLVGDAGVPSKATKIAHEFITTLGSVLSAVFFIPALYLANCSFLACVRLLMNMIVLIALGMKALREYFCMQTHILATSLSRAID